MCNYWIITIIVFEWAFLLNFSGTDAFNMFQGGLKAAILADVMQGLTMIAISVAIIIQGIVEAGGVKEVLEKNLNGSRLEFFKWVLIISVLKCGRPAFNKLPTPIRRFRLMKRNFNNGIISIFVLISGAWGLNCLNESWRTGTDWGKKFTPTFQH